MANRDTSPLLVEPYGAGGIYIVQAGDNLTTIVNRSTQSTLARPQEVIAQVLADNSHIRNADQILVGQPVFLRSASAWGTTLKATTRADIDAALCTLRTNSSPALSALARNSLLVNVALNTASGLQKGFQTLVDENRAALNELIQQHRDYRAGGASRSGYRLFNRDRTDVLQKMQQSFGRTAKSVLGDQPKNVTRLQPGRSRNPTKNLATSANRLGKISKVLQTSGHAFFVAEVVVGLEVTRQNVCAADTRQAKNLKFTGGLGGTLGGLAGGSIGGALGGVAAGIALGSNPAGWAVLLFAVMGGVGGGIAGDWAGGASAKKLYAEYGVGYDIVQAARVDSLCP